MFQESKRERPDYYFTQSAVIPYRDGPDGIEVLLITSRSHRRWIVPKGIVEPFLTPADSARKEAFEEAGIEGQVDPTPLGSYEYEKWGDLCRVEVFPLQVERELPHWEESFRDRRWFSPPGAAALIREPALKALVADLPKLLRTKKGKR